MVSACYKTYFEIFQYDNLLRGRYFKACVIVSLENLLFLYFVFLKLQSIEHSRKIVSCGLHTCFTETILWLYFNQYLLLVFSM